MATVTLTVTSVNGKTLKTSRSQVFDTVHMDNIGASGSGAEFDDYSNGFTFPTRYIVSESPADIQTAANASSGASVLLTGNQTKTGTVTFSDQQNFSAPNSYATGTGITAFATGGQASATALTKEFNEITTCATAGDSVKLPAAAAGIKVVVKNNGAAACDVFPASGDSINALAANTALSVAPNSTVVFTAVDSTIWEAGNQVVEASSKVVTDTVDERSVGNGVKVDGVRMKDGNVGIADSNASHFLNIKTTSNLTADRDLTLVTGDAARTVTLNGNPTLDDWFDQSVKTTATPTFAGATLTSTVTYAAATAITAFAGGGQASATALTKEYNDVTTVATAGDSVKLVAAALGIKQVVRNSGATALDVFPASGDAIDGGAADAAVRVNPGCEVVFEAIDTTNWKTRGGITGTVSQATSITTGVTLNARKGLITTQAASAAAGASHTFTVTNSRAVAASNIRAYVVDYAGTFTTDGLPIVSVDNRTAGTFDIVVSNAHSANALSGALVIGFEIVE